MARVRYFYDGLKDFFCLRVALFSAASPPSVLGHLVADGREVIVGAILGYGLGLFLLPAQIAGEFVTQEMGLSFGNRSWIDYAVSFVGVVKAGGVAVPLPPRIPSGELARLLADCAATGLIHPVWAMVAMAVSVTAIFINSLWGSPRLFFDAIRSVGQPVVNAQEPQAA